MTDDIIDVSHRSGEPCIPEDLIVTRKFFNPGRTAFALFLFSCLLLHSPSESCAADVFIVGDVQYRPVADIAAEIKSVMGMRIDIYATRDVRGRLNSVVRKEGARLVIALGKDAVDEAVKLPPEITVIYGLVIAPPKTSRSNITGVYMSTPVGEYLNAVRRYLPSIKKVAVIGSQELLKVLDGYHHSQVSAYRVGSSSELVDTIDRLDNSDAILLLPDVSLLTESVMDKVYLFSYRNNVPLLGISEGNVKHGSLFAIVFDPESIGRQIGEKASAALDVEDASQISPSPPVKYNLCLNVNTARKMGIAVPNEMIRKARKVYQ